MITVNIKFVQEGAEAVWDLPNDADIIHYTDPFAVAVLDKGMGSGLPSVALRFDIGEKQYLIAETSARILCTVARSIMARYPNLFEEDMS